VTRKLRILGTTASLALLLGACAKDNGDDDDGAATDPSGTSQGDGDGGSASNSMEGPMDDGTGPDPTGGDGGPDTGGTGFTASASGDTAATPLPDGSTCSEADMCESGNCYPAPIVGGLCGECDEDADCTEGGCSPPNPITMAPPHCNQGELGGGCETTDVCEKGLVCSVVLAVPELQIELSACSECDTDADCGKDLCSPSYDLMAFSGQNTCNAVGSLANGANCFLDAKNGDSVCESGFCAPADILGYAQLGVCSECDLVGEESLGCAKGEVCNMGSVDINAGAFLPAECGPPR
jgi:hypothetical protein